MDTVKYIIKRLLLAIIILLGVSIIIYGLARMMPTDFVDQQFAGAIQNGQMKQEDLDRIKEIYGLDMPDAFLTLVPESGEFDGVSFRKNTKESVYEEDILLGGTSAAEWYSGKYSADGDRQLRFSEPNAIIFKMGEATVTCKVEGTKLVASVDGGKINLPSDNSFVSHATVASDVTLETTWTGSNNTSTFVLNLSRGKGVYTETNDVAGTVTPYEFVYTYGGTVQIGKIESVSIESSGEDGDDQGLVVNDVFTPALEGTYQIDFPKIDPETGNIDFSQVRNFTVTADGTSFDVAANYRVASFWDKAGSIFESYFEWLGNMLKGDFGVSFKYKMPVGDVIVQNMGVSFAIAFIATILQFLIAIPLGIKAAVKQYGVTDYVVTIFTMIGISLPTFFLSALVIRLFAVQLGWFEVSGIASASMAPNASWIVKLGDNLWHMVLPMFVLVVLSIGSLMRYTRTNTLEALNADYVRTARAKGLSERSVIYKHAFRNTMVPLVTLLAGTLPGLFSGAMITETVFAIPGIGKLAYDALVVADVPFIMGYNMFLAVLTVLGTLLSDLMYAVVDPRVKIGK